MKFVNTCFKVAKMNMIPIYPPNTSPVGWSMSVLNIF